MGKKGGRKKFNAKSAKEIFKSKGKGKAKGNRLHYGGKGLHGSKSGGIVVANAITHSDLIRLEQSTKAKFGLYTNMQKILLVGEGNFTFAAALATRLGGDNICATSLDTRKEVLDKYSDTAKQALKTLDSTGVMVLHGIDATSPVDFKRMREKFEEKKVNPIDECSFDRVVFNFPHCGGATEQDVKINRNMLRGFFSSARSVLNIKGGQVHVTLRDTPFYKSWSIEDLAEAESFYLVKKDSIKSLQDFIDLGYQEARTNPATRAAPTTENALTYIFSLSRVETKMKKRKQNDVTGKISKKRKS
mmetsp:Transcript_32265/g.39690  ORF Transcript_32265/g.39690 Transcript_32265/m.39690 type:complete len:303 (+) Transcript_32265:191-1099(+)